MYKFCVQDRAFGLDMLSVRWLYPGSLMSIYKRFLAGVDVNTDTLAAVTVRSDEWILWACNAQGLNRAMPTEYQELIRPP